MTAIGSPRHGVEIRMKFTTSIFNPVVGKQSQLNWYICPVVGKHFKTLLLARHGVESRTKFTTSIIGPVVGKQTRHSTHRPYATCIIILHFTIMTSTQPRITKIHTCYRT